MLAAAGVPVVVEALVEVGLAVVVEVVQPRELAAFEDDDLAVHHLQAERLIQPGGEALPGARRGLLVHRHEPDVAVAGADGDAAVGEEVEAGAEEQCAEAVLVGDGERVHRERAGLLAAFELGDDRLAPALRAAFCDRRQVFILWKSSEELPNIFSSPGFARP